MRGQRIGYVRVSSFDQNPERQVVVQALRGAGYAERQPVVLLGNLKESMTIHIRAANLADAGSMARIHIDMWRTTYAGIVSAEYLAGLSYQIRKSRWADIVDLESL